MYELLSPGKQSWMGSGHAPPSPRGFIKQMRNKPSAVRVYFCRDGRFLRQLHLLHCTRERENLGFGQFSLHWQEMTMKMLWFLTLTDTSPISSLPGLSIPCARKIGWNLQQCDVGTVGAHVRQPPACGCRATAPAPGKGLLSLTSAAH